MCDCYKIPERIKIKYNKLLREKNEEKKEENPIIIN
jgi:hypothetical protein